MISRTTQSKIHIARQQLGMEDETYRQVLQRASGKTSTASMTENQGQSVLQEMTRLGWKPKPSSKKGGKAKGKPHNFDQLPEMITKIEALLADMELPWSYADSIANRMWKRQRIAWTREPKKLQAILAALHNEQTKRGLLATLENLMETLGPTDPKWQALLDSQRKGWERHIPTLKRLVEVLASGVNNLEGDSDVDGR